MKHVWNSCILLLCVFIAIANSSAQNANGTRGTIRIGILTDLSSDRAEWGRKTLAGASLAQQDMWGEGLPVEFFVGDHALRPDKAETSASKLLHVEGVDALYSEHSPASEAASPLALAANKFFFYIGDNSSILTANRLALNSPSHPLPNCASVARYWSRRGLWNMAMLKNTLGDGVDCLQGLRKIIPAATNVDYKSEDELESQLAFLKQKAIMAFAHDASEVGSLRIFRELARLHYAPEVFLAEASLTPAVLKELSTEQIGKIVSHTYQPLSSTFLERLNAKSKVIVPETITAAALAYLHISQLTRALHRCPNREASCVTAIMEKSPPQKAFGFRGFHNRQAELDTVINSWKNLRPEVIVQEYTHRKSVSPDLSPE